MRVTESLGMRPHLRWWPLASIAAGTALFAWLAFVMLSPDAVYSGDFGVKFVQARELYDHHFTSLRIAYRGAFLDPEAKFTPLRPPFVFVTAAGVQAIFPPAAAVLQAIFVPLGGIVGMRILSVIAGALTLWGTGRLSPRGWAGATVPLVMALATPFWFYAVIESEHAPAIALGAVAFVLVLSSAELNPWRAGAAGLTLGAAAAIRDESILLMPGLLFACWLRTRSWRTPAFAVGGCLATLAAAAAVEVWWFGRPMAAHLRHAVHLLQTALRLTSKPNLELPELAPLTLQQRYDYVGHYWLFGTDSDRSIFALIGIVAAAAAARRWFKSAWLLLPALLVLIVFAGIDAAHLIAAPKWIAGLYRLSPFVVFAVLPPPVDCRERCLRRVSLFALVTYVALAFAGVDTSGGKSLGPRLLLALLPLLVASAWRNIADFTQSTRLPERAVGWAGLVLTAIALVIHAAGTIPAYVTRSAEDASAMRTINDAPERIIVADDMYTAQQLLPMYYSRLILLADTPQGAADLGETLNRERVGSAILVSRRPDAPIALAPFRKTDVLQRGRFRIEFWRR